MHGAFLHCRFGSWKCLLNIFKYGFCVLGHFFAVLLLIWMAAQVFAWPFGTVFSNLLECSCKVAHCKIDWLVRCRVRIDLVRVSRISTVDWLSEPLIILRPCIFSPSLAFWAFVGFPNFSYFTLYSVAVPCDLLIVMNDSQSIVSRVHVVS